MPDERLNQLISEVRELAGAIRALNNTLYGHTDLSRKQRSIFRSDLDRQLRAILRRLESQTQQQPEPPHYSYEDFVDEYPEHGQFAYERRS